MNTEYTLFILKSNKENLLERLANLDKELTGRHSKENIAKLKTKIKHDLGSLDFSIEVLETYLD
jgi:hypothetical protein